MAISASSPIDFGKIALEMRATVARWYNASVEVIDPELGDLVWDMETNTFENDPVTIIWSGEGRIQQIHLPEMKTNDVMETSIVSIRIQIPYDNTRQFIRKGMAVRVTNGGENHDLANLEFTVRSAINSSYGWNTTLECEVDAKSTANDTEGS
jgi:hypothetical protein